MAIQHVFSNVVPDATGTMTIWNGATTATVAATAVVRPSDWNSAHNNNVTLSGNTVGVSTVSGSNIVFAGGPNVTLSAVQGANVATISFSGGAGAAGNTGYISAGTTNASLGTLSFADSNGVSFGINGQAITATVATNYQSQGAYLTTAMASNRGSDFVQATAAFAGTNASGTIASGGISVSVAAPVALTSWTVSDAATSGTVGRLAFTNLNGVTLSLSSGTGGFHTIVGSHNALTTAAASDHSHGNPTLALTNLSGTTASNSAGFTLSLSAGAGGAGDGVNILAAGTQTAATTGTVLFQNANGITFGMSNSSVITASHNGLTSQSNQAFSAGAASSAFQTLVFQDSNGVSFSNNAGAIRVTHDLQFTSATSAITSNALHSSAARVINIVAATNNAGGGTASLSSNVSFSAANGLTFYTSAGGAIVGSHNAITTARASTDAIGLATAQSNVTWTVNSAGLSFDARGYAGTATTFAGTNVSGSITLNSNGLNLALSAATAAPSPVNFSAGTTSNNLASVVFANSNGVSFGLNGSTITASVAAGGGGFASIGISTQGNTSGTTGFASVSMQLVGSNNITLSQATSNNGAYTLTISGPSRPRIELFAPLAMPGAGSAPAGFSYAGYSNGTLHVQPLHGINDVFPGDMTLDRIGILWSATHTNSTATTQALTSTVAMGIYTLVNATQLSRAFSGTMSFAVAAGNSNSTLFNGMRWITINSNQWDTQPTLSNTLYWIASMALSAGTSFSGQGGMGVRVGNSAQISGFMGAASASAASNPNFFPFHGYLSASTNALPVSIGASNMIATGSAIGQMNFHYVLQGSAARSAMGIW